MKRLIVLNDKAGRFSASNLEQAICEALAHYPEADACEFIEPTDTQVLREHLTRHQNTLTHVWVAGGDGTVMQVVDAMKDLGLDYPIAIIPVGTGNRLAKNLGIPVTIRGAVDVAMGSTTQRVDIGKINDTYFALMAGAGLDADIMHHVLPEEKKALGVWAYIWQGFQRIWFTPTARFVIEADGKAFVKHGIGVIIANAGNLLGPYFTLTPGAKVDDGLLDLCVLQSRGRFDYAALVTDVLLQVSQDNPGSQSGLFHCRAREFVIRSTPILRAQADGDVIGTTPLVIQAIADAIEIVVPAEKPPLEQITGWVTDPLVWAQEQLMLMLHEVLPTIKFK